jgi:hypothetical protein
VRRVLVGLTLLIALFPTSGCGKRHVVRDNFSVACAEVSREECSVSARWTADGSSSEDWDLLIAEVIPTLMHDLRKCALIARSRAECLERGEAGDAICGFKESCPETE